MARKVQWAPPVPKDFKAFKVKPDRRVHKASKVSRECPVHRARKDLLAHKVTLAPRVLKVP
jgi:hypothetical protein